MDVGFKTDKGLKRSNNEDACFVLENDKVFIVADGVGGNKSGEIASRTAVTEISKYVKEHPIAACRSKSKIQHYLQECIENVNLKILGMSQRFEENSGMATTVVLIYFANRKAYILNVGDSRAYTYRQGKLYQITEDHTYVNTLIKAGLISHKEALTHEKKNMITRAVGADYEVEADFFEVAVGAGDIFLLCTDGLYGEVSDEEITEEFDRNKSMSQTCNELIDKANKNGGSDNITMICVKVMEEDIDE